MSHSPYFLFPIFLLTLTLCVCPTLNINQNDNMKGKKILYDDHGYDGNHIDGIKDITD